MKNNEHAQVTDLLSFSSREKTRALCKGGYVPSTHSGKVGRAVLCVPPLACVGCPFLPSWQAGKVLCHVWAVWSHLHAPTPPRAPPFPPSFYSPAFCVITQDRPSLTSFPSIHTTQHHPQQNHLRVSIPTALPQKGNAIASQRLLCLPVTSSGFFNFPISPSRTFPHKNEASSNCTRQNIIHHHRVCRHNAGRREQTRVQVPQTIQHDIIAQEW